MTDKKVTDQLLDRIKYFINAIENGEYEPQGYEFTVSVYRNYGRKLTICDSYLDPNYNDATRIQLQ